MFEFLVWYCGGVLWTVRNSIIDTKDEKMGWTWDGNGAVTHQKWPNAADLDRIWRQDNLNILYSVTVNS